MDTNKKNKRKNTISNDGWQIRDDSESENMNDGNKNSTDNSDESSDDAMNDRGSNSNSNSNNSNSNRRNKKKARKMHFPFATQLQDIENTLQQRSKLIFEFLKHTKQNIHGMLFFLFFFCLH